MKDVMMTGEVARRETRDARPWWDEWLVNVGLSGR